MNKKVLETVVNVRFGSMCKADEIWSQYSSDKPDIGENLAKVIRTLDKALPLSVAIRALSIGSSVEPQI